MSTEPRSWVHSPIAELVGLVEGVRVLEGRISECVAACCEHGYGATEVARILGVHRATVYRLSSWRERSGTEQRDEKRGTMVSVRFGGEELERIREAAERRGSSVSAYIRSAILTENQLLIVEVASSSAAVDPPSSQTVIFGN